MIVVDTNVLSEPMRATPDPAVLAWLGRHADELVATSVSVAELLFEAARLPQGARRHAFERQISSLAATFAVLPFRQEDAGHYAHIRAAQQAAGITAGPLDVQIAAIARARGFAVATRNVRHFDAADVKVINPWGDA